MQIVLATHDAFAVFGAGWGDLNALNSPQWLWFDFPLMSGIGAHLTVLRVTLFLGTDLPH